MPRHSGTQAARTGGSVWATSTRLRSPSHTSPARPSRGRRGRGRTACGGRRQRGRHRGRPPARHRRNAPTPREHRAEPPSQQMGLRPPAGGDACQHQFRYLVRKPLRVSEPEDRAPRDAEHQSPVNAELGAQLFRCMVTTTRNASVQVRCAVSCAVERALRYADQHDPKTPLCQDRVRQDLILNH
jgi:hypothetical protein